MAKTIGNPGSWAMEAVAGVGRAVAQAARGFGGTGTVPEIEELDMEDLRDALRLGWEDFLAFRDDVIFIILVYPVVGALLAFAAFRGDLLHLVFPAAGGFALLGPVAAIGLYEMSRRREAGEAAGWADALGVLRSPRIAPIAFLAAVLAVTFVFWVGAAQVIYDATLGPEPPASAAAFLGDVLTTPPGWTMTVVGMAVGFLFAAAVLAVSIVSFPMLIDREVGLPVAVVTSLRVARRNPRMTAAWGLIVAVGLAAGSLPAFLGLIVVLPVLGHATWHFYRRAVAPA